MLWQKWIGLQKQICKNKNKRESAWRQSGWRPQVLINNDNQFIFSNWLNFKVFVIIHYAKHVLITSPYRWVFVTHWQQDISWAVHNNIQQRSIMLSFFLLRCFSSTNFEDNNMHGEYSGARSSFNSVIRSAGAQVILKQYFG